jgi:hypothetical protein
MPAGLILGLLAGALLLLGQEGGIGELGKLAAQMPSAAKLVLLALGIAVASWRPADLAAGVRVAALAMLGLSLIAHWGLRETTRQHYGLQDFANRLSEIERVGAPIAHWREYHGDFNFLARLRQPLVEASTPALLHEWLRTHPAGYVVLLRQPDPNVSEDGAELAQFYRGRRRLTLWKSAELLCRPQNLERMLRRAD